MTCQMILLVDVVTNQQLHIGKASKTKTLQKHVFLVSLVLCFFLSPLPYMGSINLQGRNCISYHLDCVMHIYVAVQIIGM